MSVVGAASDANNSGSAVGAHVSSRSHLDHIREIRHVHIHFNTVAMHSSESTRPYQCITDGASATLLPSKQHVGVAASSQALIEGPRPCAASAFAFASGALVAARCGLRKDLAALQG